MYDLRALLKTGIFKASEMDTMQQPKPHTS